MRRIRLRKRSNRRRVGTERGAIAVEAAIASSLLVLMFFGVLEVGQLLRTRAVMTDASREGARVAAALPREDGYQNSALAAINGVVANAEGEPIDYVVVYKADPATGDILSGEVLEDCVIDCWRFLWVAGGFQQQLGAAWPADEQNACGGVGDTDWLAVYVRGHYQGISPMLTIDRSFTDRTIMRLEPIELGLPCRP